MITETPSHLHSLTRSNAQAHTHTRTLLHIYHLSVSNPILILKCGGGVCFVFLLSPHDECENANEAGGPLRSTTGLHLHRQIGTQTEPSRADPKNDLHLAVKLIPHPAGTLLLLFFTLFV